MTDDLRAPGFYVISPEEAASIGMPKVTWYVMPARDEHGPVSCLTTNKHAVDIVERAAAGADEPDADWAVDQFSIVRGDPSTWPDELANGG